MMMRSTRIFVQVAVDDDSGDIAALILAITALVGLLVQLGRFVQSVTLWVNDFVEAYHFTITVFSIGFRSLAWGMGARL